MSFLNDALSSFDRMDKEKRLLCAEVWNSVSDGVQRKKLTQNGISDPTERDRIIDQLKIRPALLVHVADCLMRDLGRISSFAEVGTAQGLQSILFAKAFPDASVFTCDVKDDRDESFKTQKNLWFVNGDSKQMSKVLSGKDKIDFCWIDGAHDHYSVVNDFAALVLRTHSETVWAFDDYDKRFGCFYDINTLVQHFREHIVVELGLTASGNPNRIVLARGFE